MTGMHAGPSLIEQMWAKLDALVDELQSGHYEVTTVGQAQGVAWCIALWTDPYNIRVNVVRAEAMRRWEARKVV